MVQFCLGTQHSTFCVNLSTIERKTDEEDISKLGASFRLIKFLELDAAPLNLSGDYFVTLREDLGLKPVDAGYLEKNAKLLYNFIDLHFNKLDAIEKGRNKNLQQRLNGLDTFNEFMQCQVGHDDFLNEAIDFEKTTLKNNIGAVGHHKKYLLKSFCNTNFVTTKTNTLLYSLTTDIKSMPMITSSGNFPVLKLLTEQAVKNLGKARKNV